MVRDALLHSAPHHKAGRVLARHHVAEMQRRGSKCIVARQIPHFVVFDEAVGASAQALPITIFIFRAGLRFPTRANRRGWKLASRGTSIGALAHKDADPRRKKFGGAR